MNRKDFRLRRVFLLRVCERKLENIIGLLVIFLLVSEDLDNFGSWIVLVRTEGNFLREIGL